MDKLEVARKIRHSITLKGWKPRDLKLAVANLGAKITDSSLSNYLSIDPSNNRIPPPATALIIAKALGVKYSSLFGAEFEEHDRSLDGLTRCGDIAYTSRLMLSKNTEAFRVTDRTVNGVFPGDILIIDQDDKNISAGLYLITLNNSTQVRNVRFDGKNYQVNLNGKDTPFNQEGFSVSGKVVAKFTTNV